MTVSYQNAIYGYWPLEESVTYPALAEIEVAVRHHLKVASMRTEVAAELHTLANVIRALLQHVTAERKAADKAAREADPDPLLE